MRNSPMRTFWAVMLMLGASSTSGAAEPADIALRGTGTVAACATCHGRDGGGQASFPRLAGMNASYLLKQLQDFDNGQRENAVMKPIASALSASDRKAIAKYYAALPVPSALAKPKRVAPSGQGEGARLALRGNWSKGVPGCVQCHGPGGVGVGDNFPAIAGQPAGYIEAQLQAWQKGTRKNDPLQLMQHLSRQLSAAEIKAVSAWFAGQPTNATETRP